MATIAQIAVEVDARTAGFKRGMATMRQGLQTVSKHARTAGLALTPFTAAMGLAVRQAVKTGDEYHKMALRTGESVENLSALSHAAELSGTSMQVVEKGLRNLSQRAVDFSKGIGIAKDAFEELGIQVTNSTGRMKTGTALTLEIAEALRNVEDDTRRAALAMDVFGMRAGPAMLPLLREGQAGIRKLMEEADKLGITMSTRDAAAAAQFNDQLTRLKGSVAGISREIVMSFLPILESVVAGFVNMSKSTKRHIGMVVALLGVGGPLMLGLSALAGHPVIAGVALFATAIGAVAVAFLTWRDNVIKVNEALALTGSEIQKLTLQEAVRRRAQLNERAEGLAQKLVRFQQPGFKSVAQRVSAPGWAQQHQQALLQIEKLDAQIAKMEATAPPPPVVKPPPVVTPPPGAGAGAGGPIEFGGLQGEIAQGLAITQAPSMAIAEGFQKAQEAAQSYRLTMNDVAEQTKIQLEQQAQAANSFGNAMASVASGMVQNWGNLADFFSTMVKQMISNLAGLLVKMIAVRVAMAFIPGGGVGGAVIGGLTKVLGFASGGVVTKPTLGMVGEKGPEAVIPLSRMGRTGGPQIVSVQIDGREIARATAEHMPGELARRGAA